MKWSLREEVAWREGCGDRPPSHWTPSYRGMPREASRFLLCSVLVGIVSDTTDRLHAAPVAAPKLLKRGRQFISPVLIYRKCTQRSIGLLQGKSGFLEKKNWANRGRPSPPPTPFESATALRYFCRLSEAVWQQPIADWWEICLNYCSN